ncbi:MAG: PQQ-binding-like beta-propeller repeat protein [Planctomycetes bacterium]|nr:PQQ-binding-like beta-propeller repeat protein [Planctomycetota bacterium]
MDPLSDQLTCACVLGYAQRRYTKLASFIEKRVGRSVHVAYAENLREGLKRFGGGVDLIIGKRSSVVADAAECNVPVSAIAMLTDLTGSTDLTGLFVVRHDDPATGIAALKGRTIVFGPADALEKHGAAIAAAEANGVPLPKTLKIMQSCNAGAVAVIEKDAAAAVISSYAAALLEGCDIIDKGSVRIVGSTAPVPFITAFAAGKLDGAARAAVLKALLAVREDPSLLKDMESKNGFVAITRPEPWPDWRGRRRDAISAYVPARLPERPAFLWKHHLTGLGLSGVAATAQYVIVADKDAKAENDIFRCLDANTGNELWALTYPAAGEMDYSNAPRANPVIHDGLVYLLGAFGHLHCVKLDTGEIVWKRNVIEDFGAELQMWGMCVAPLIVDDKLIVNPGAEDASVVALSPTTGKVVWQTPGNAAAYAAFIVGTFGGVRQIVGYDALSLGGWDIATGERLWELVPEEDGDFNVPTPISVGGELLVSTENNATRLYGFDERGRIRPKPICSNPALTPDTATPVVLNGKVFGAGGKFYCLDLKDNLKTLWQKEDGAFDDYASVIGGNGRILITTIGGELLLIEASEKRFELISRLRLFDDAEIWSHPALVGDHLYVRDHDAVYCVVLGR